MNNISLTKRQCKLIELALRYTLANLDDVCDSFCDDPGIMQLRGQKIAPPTEKEIGQLIRLSEFCTIN